MAFPLDISFPSWVSYPGTPSEPGAGDINKLQEAIKNLANPPSAAMSRTDVQLIPPTSGTFAVLFFNQALWDTANMIPPIGPAYTDRIHLPYVGLWELACTVRTQANSSTGYGKLRLTLINANNSITTIIDQDEHRNQTDGLAEGQMFHTSAKFLLTAAQLATGASIRADYAQNSSGDTSLRVLSPSYPGFPILSAHWLGTGGL